MAIGLAGAAAITGASALLGQGASMVATGKMNKKNRAFAEEQAWKTNERAIENWERQNRYDEFKTQGDRQYNEAMWAKQNEYDSPQAQMARYEEAGLNPNLIYGQSNMGGSIATAESQNSGPIGPPAKAEHRDQLLNTPQPLDAIFAINQFRKDQAQIDLVAEQKKNVAMDTALKAAKIPETEVKTKRGQFDYDLVSELRETSIQAATAGLNKIWQETDLLHQQYANNNEMQPILVKKAWQEIQEGKQRIFNAKQESELKKYQIQLQKQGINPGDPTWIRMIVQFLNNSGMLPDILK